MLLLCRVLKANKVDREIKVLTFSFYLQTSIATLWEKLVNIQRLKFTFIVPFLAYLVGALANKSEDSHSTSSNQVL